VSPRLGETQHHEKFEEISRHGRPPWVIGRRSVSHHRQDRVSSPVALTCEDSTTQREPAPPIRDSIPLQ
ncbi:hypothetical protein AB0I10_37325, partial [Streptomyces sp. NPDC050636]|uniref:hypothetical protein n=1 Tax=Streptomyces sp. NPDC050636 TaxID=3154510 RepID=UPI0034237F85